MPVTKRRLSLRCWFSLTSVVYPTTVGVQTELGEHPPRERGLLRHYTVAQTPKGGRATDGFALAHLTVRHPATRKTH